MNRSDFINRSRQLASNFIRDSDAFNALYAELELTDAALPAENGGLGPEDFVAGNADISRDQLLAFYQTLGALLGPLTAAQKKTLYAVKTSSGNAGGPLLSNL